MALFAAIDRSLQTSRSSFRLREAFDEWKRKMYPALSFFGDVDDFIDWWTGTGIPKDRISNEALKALCIEATDPSHDGAGANRQTPSQAEEAALLLLGVLIPRLRSWIRDAGIPALDQEDVEAEIAAGLWEAVATTTGSQTGTAGRLMNAARRRVRGAARREIAHERLRRDLPPAVDLGPGGGRHPEDLIEQGLAEGILNPVEADLILSIRFNEESPRKAGWRHRLTPKAVEHRLVRAEARLLAWMNGEPVPTRFAVTARRPFLSPSVPSGVSGLREADTYQPPTRDGEEVASVSRAGETRRPGATTGPARETADHGSG